MTLFLDLANLSTNQGIGISGNSNNLWTGLRAISNAGYVNGDGYDDVIISARHLSSESGIYVIYGESNLVDIDLDSLNAAQGFSIATGVTTPGGLGSGGAGVDSVAIIKDVNGDNYDDIIVGIFTTGITYLIYGGAGIANIDLTSLSSGEGISISGASVSSVSDAGNVNGDSYNDFIIGALGSSYLIYGKASFSNINQQFPLVFFL